MARKTATKAWIAAKAPRARKPAAFKLPVVPAAPPAPVPVPMSEVAMASLGYTRRESPDRFTDFYRTLRGLLEDLGKIVPDDRLDSLSIDEMVEEMLTTPLGEVPSWSRPGTFLEWLGPIPLVCEWGGLPRAYACIKPATPTQIIPDPLYIGTCISPDARTVRDHFRLGLAELGEASTWKKGKLISTFDLQQVRGWQAEEAGKYLAEHEWLRKALARGPVDPVALPDTILSVQLPL